MKIMFNRTVSDRDPMAGVNEYVVWSGKDVLRRFEAKSVVAERYAAIFGLEQCSPMEFWRDVVCA